MMGVKSITNLRHAHHQNINHHHHHHHHHHQWTIFTNDTEKPGTLHEIRSIYGFWCKVTVMLEIGVSYHSLPFNLQMNDWLFHMRQEKPGDFFRAGVKQRVATHKLHVPNNVMQYEVAFAGLFHCG
jgi:hypothetical protein